MKYKQDIRTIKEITKKFADLMRLMSVGKAERIELVFNNICKTCLSIDSADAELDEDRISREYNECLIKELDYIFRVETYVNNL